MQVLYVRFVLDDVKFDVDSLGKQYKCPETAAKSSHYCCDRTI
jgi:hypothetical protein